MIKTDVRKQYVKQFEFDSSFIATFNALMNLYSRSLDKLNSILNSAINSEYCICNCCYKLRYITPKDVSTFISNYTNAVTNRLFNTNITDIEMFMTVSAKRFMEANGCVPFESSNVLDGANHYVNPKNQTLNDLEFMCKNDIPQKMIYSRGEMVKRIELMGDDVKKLNDMHFSANMRKIISSLPSILDDSIGNTFNRGTKQMFIMHIEEFIIFVCELNILTVLQLIEYICPSAEWTTIPTGNNNVVTESCCMIKTNNYMIQNRMPFNCNMRDVVLQDVTPDFKDTYDALCFIMRDNRSPISILVNKYASKQADEEPDFGIISSLFINYRDRYCPTPSYTKDGNTVSECPKCVNGFGESSGWLDNIAYGNNYLDGNYRRDAVGNNHSNPIINSLDALYKIFGGVSLTSNEDVANNIVRIACSMRTIMRMYHEKRQENYDLTKDILALLGEILTRNMLKLYNNNTRVYCYDDNMPDAAVPGFLCMEGYVMEDGESVDNSGTTTASANTTNTANTGSSTTNGTSSNNTTNTNNTNTNGTKTTVTFSNKDNQSVKKNINTNVSIIINRFIEWVRNQLSKFSENFNKNHKREIEWIKNNMKLNEEISNAIGKSFFPHVSNLPKFNIPADKLINGVKVSDLVNEWIDMDKTKTFNQDEALIRSTGLDEANMKELRLIKDLNKQSEAYINYILFSNIKNPVYINGPMKSEDWTSLYKDLLATPDLITKVTKAFADDLNKACTTLKSKLQTLEQDKEKNANAIERCEAVNKVIQNCAKMFKTKAINTINNKFYAKNYVVYREIVTAYKQQSNNSVEESNNSGESIETPNAVGEINSNENNTQ